MLCVIRYSQDYVDAARAKVDAHVSAYTRLRAGAPADPFDAVCFTMVLALDVGDEIELDEPGFRRLADAFFADIERKYA